MNTVNNFTTSGCTSFPPTIHCNYIAPSHAATNYLYPTMRSWQQSTSHFCLTVTMVIAMYRVGKKSPHTKQCANIINFNYLCTSWLHFEWIWMRTLILDTQAEALTCPLWNVSENLLCNSVKGNIHSSAQICNGGTATRSHTLPLILPHKDLPIVIRSRI